MPASPSTAPPMTCGRIGRFMKRRPLIAFQIGAVENTTATRPLGTHIVA